MSNEGETIAEYLSLRSSTRDKIGKIYILLQSIFNPYFWIVSEFLESQIFKDKNYL